MRDDIRDKIKGQIEGHRVLLFMKGNRQFPQCGFSARVVEALKRVGAEFETVNVLADPELRDGVKEYSNWPTIPQLYIDQKLVGGCDITLQLFQTGELARLIKGESAPS